MFAKPENQIEKNPNSSNYWNLTGFPIYIDDTDPNYNWSKISADNDWCRGNGSQGNPYIIENITINGQGSGSCIEIRSSNVYFIIRNCTLYRSGSVLDADGGIMLLSVNNGKLIDNNCSFNGNGIFLIRSEYISISGNIVNNNIGNGIRLRESGWNTLSGNIANHNHIGINIFNGHHNIISGNIASNNFDDGLNLDSSTINNISGNTAYNNMDSGIYISEGNLNEIMENVIDNNKISGIDLNQSFYCTVSGNNITNNNYGIYLEGEGAHEISENNASYNNFGLYSFNSNGNNISSNIVDINEIGIYLENSNNTYILENNVINNSIGLYLYQSNHNYIVGNFFVYNSLVMQEIDCEGNYFKDNIGIPDSNGRFPSEIVIIIVISIISAMITVGMVIFKRKSSRKEIISKNLLSSHKLKKELRKTEAEVSVEKEHHFCVVHRGKIVGAIYLCPKCETYYCMKCATVLKNKGEACWACSNEIEL